MKKRISIVSLLILMISTTLFAQTVTTPKPEVSKVKAEELQVGKVIKMEKNPEAGFHWPYYLYIPSTINKEKENYIFVEPNNAWPKEVPYVQIEDSAFGTASKNKLYSEELGIPVVVPIFPGSDNIKAHTKAYYHAINEEALLTQKETYKRIDLQLLAMIKDARVNLLKDNIKTKEKIVINGFSDSGNFANRFTGLHPEKVKVMVAGGINVFLFPIKEYKGTKFNYPLGVNDLSKYTGREFNHNAYDAVAKYIYRGTADHNDPVYGVNFMTGSLKDFIFKNLAKDIPKRLEISKQIYEANSKNIQFVLYDGIDHSIPKEISADIIKFIASNLEDEYKVIEPFVYTKEYIAFRSKIKTAYYLGGREISEHAQTQFGVQGDGTSPANAKTSILKSSDLIVCAAVGTEPISSEVKDLFQDLFKKDQKTYINYKKMNNKYYVLVKAETKDEVKKLINGLGIEQLKDL